MSCLAIGGTADAASFRISVDSPGGNALPPPIAAAPPSGTVTSRPSRRPPSQSRPSPRTDHIMAVLSKDAVTRRLPSAENATPRTVFVCPSTLTIGTPDIAFHTTATLSRPHVATRRPSAEKHAYDICESWIPLNATSAPCMAVRSVMTERNSDEMERCKRCAARALSSASELAGEYASVLQIVAHLSLCSSFVTSTLRPSGWKHTELTPFALVSTTSLCAPLALLCAAPH